MVAVILYHFVPWLMPGGFLGVDAFFVVSGFLIARLLVRDLGVHGNVRLGRFWGRRVRRLLPAALTTIFIVMCAALLLLSAVQLHDLRDQLIASVLYGANWMLIAGKTSYFATLQAPSPLIHMWSLAVEEQFYVIFPLVLVVCGRWLRSGWKLTAGVLVVGALASTALMALLYQGGDPSRIYYGTDTHAMGLLLGAALGVMSLAPGIDAWGWPLRVTNVAALFAFAAVLLAMFSTHQESAWLYQGGFLVFSALCCVVIWSVAHARTTALAKLLSINVLVAVGLRSYSLYLWHWPVRVFVDTDTTGLTGWQLTLLRTVVLVLLAEASYQLVERAFRTGTLFKRFGIRSTLVYAGALDRNRDPRRDLRDHGVAAADQPGRCAQVGRPIGSRPHFDARRRVRRLDRVRVRRQRHPRVPESSRPADRRGRGTGVLDRRRRPRQRRPRHRPTRGVRGVAARVAPGAHGATRGAQRDGADDGRVGGPRSHRRREHRQARDTRVDHARCATRSTTPSAPFARPRHRSSCSTPPATRTAPPTSCSPNTSDPKRIKAYNEILTQATAGLPDVHLVKFHALVCPGGQHLETVHGEDLWQGDGVHLSDAGRAVRLAVAAPAGEGRARVRAELSRQGVRRLVASRKARSCGRVVTGMPDCRP